MPKEVDHPTRRRELADAACRVVARQGLNGTTLAQVATESGWSIGSIRHYFADKDQLVAAALWRIGERVDERIRGKVGDRMGLGELRIAALELLPLDAARREEALVHLAFMAQAAVETTLSEAADESARLLQKPLTARIAHLVETGELDPSLDPKHEGARLRVLLDGLALQLVTSPKTTSRRWAQRLVEDHLAGLHA